MFLKIGLCFIVLRFISAFELNCIYFDSVDGYNCKADNLAIESPNQKIAKVNGKHAKGFSVVETFYVHRNPKVTYLPIGLNEHFPQLKKLDVQLTSLKYITKDDFFGLELLEIIDFNGNQIEIIPSDVFSTLTNLEHLSLSKNKITKLFSSTFENLHKLQELYLQDNQIEELDENLFINNSELKIISLSRNRFKIIGAKIVSKLIKLTKIEFNGDKNCITKNYNLKSDIKKSLLIIEKDLKSLCSNTVEVPKKTIEDFKSNLTQLDTQVFNLLSEKNNLNQKLMEENENVKIIQLKLQQQMELNEQMKIKHKHTVDFMTNSSQESEKNHKSLLQNLNNENLDLTTKLQNLNQTFIQENSQLKKEHAKVVDEMEKISEDVKKQLKYLQQSHNKLKDDSQQLNQTFEHDKIKLKDENKNLTQQVLNQNNNITLMTKEITDIKLNLETVEKLNLSCNKTELNDLTNDNKNLNIKLRNLQKTMEQEIQSHQQTIEELQNDSITNMTLLNIQIEDLEQSLTNSTAAPEIDESKSGIATKYSVVFTFVKKYSDETLLLCSVCFNIFLIILLLRSPKKTGTVQNIETTLVMTEKRKSRNYS